MAKAPEPRKALPISSEPDTTLHDESAKAVTKNYADTDSSLLSEEEIEEEIEAIADGTEDGDAEPSEVDEDDDEGYF